MTEDAKPEVEWFGPSLSDEGWGYFGLCYDPWHSKSFPIAVINGKGTDLAGVMDAASQFVVEGIELELRRFVDIYQATEDGTILSGYYDIIRVGIRPGEDDPDGKEAAT